MKTVEESNFPELLTTFMNKCLDLKIFPTPFKTGLIVLFHKKGKEKNSINSYRPISLLPILGKLLEKLLLQRVSVTINKQIVLHPHQFGFREGKSINHALRKLLSVIENAKKREHYVIVISLDIQEAFDNLKYDIIRKELRKLYTESNISETLEDILSNRKAAFQTTDVPAVWKQTQGCPQGSCTSPLFWNIVADEILKTDWPKEIQLQAFADDFAFVISGRTWNSTQVSPSKLSRIGLTKIYLIYQWKNHNIYKYL
ncbi:putative RNA-directed DNA polymerase from transposon BS [Araneus ventricosus]|uniref:Putative RNA-directed DNA polymerase from transposon BS n=1 Tax=Araneus ventricosus TaxID=182803 RepID=A0A4Y2X4E4_ARAVE|nr:putative RNA-directed DNA polymerase from transposon BS [Araneus ventricosus]GBO44383.1 putative RNA-directed DNA polymerase from transposon BS [Araneus ventricosus]